MKNKEKKIRTLKTDESRFTEKEKIEAGKEVPFEEPVGRKISRIVRKNIRIFQVSVVLVTVLLIGLVVFLGSSQKKEVTEPELSPQEIAIKAQKEKVDAMRENAQPLADNVIKAQKESKNTQPLPEEIIKAQKEKINKTRSQ